MLEYNRKIKNDLQFFKISKPVQSGKAMTEFLPIFSIRGGAGYDLGSDDDEEESATTRGTTTVGDETTAVGDETTAVGDETTATETFESVDDSTTLVDIDDDEDAEISVSRALTTTTVLKKVAPESIYVDEDPYIFIKNLESGGGGYELNFRPFDPLEVKVLKDLFLTPRLTFKTKSYYEQLLSQNQLRLAYVPDRTKNVPKLQFNQEWLQAIVDPSAPLPPVVTTDNKFSTLMKEDRFWSELLKEQKEQTDPKTKAISANTLPISSKEIREFNRGFAEPNTENSVETLRNINLIRPYVSQLSKKTKKTKSHKDQNIQKVQDRILGPLGKLVLGAENVYQILYEPMRPLSSKSSDEENSQDFTHVDLIPMAGHAILEGDVNGLITMDNRVIVSDTDIPVTPVLKGERIALAKYYKLPIGFEPVSFYSNFLLNKKISVLNTEIKNNIGKHSQTEIREGAFQVTSPEGFSKIMGVFQDLVLKPSAYIDLLQIEGLLKYFNLDLKYLNRENLSDLAKLMAEHMPEGSATFRQIKTFKELYNKHIKSLRTPIRLASEYYPLKTSSNMLISESASIDSEKVESVKETNVNDEEETKTKAEEAKAEETKAKSDEAKAEEARADAEAKAEEAKAEEAKAEEAKADEAKADKKSTEEPENTGKSGKKYELSQPLGIPIRLVWKTALDKSIPAKFAFLERFQQHLKSYPSGLKAISLTSVPDNTTIPADLQIPKQYAGLFLEFPQTVNKPADLNSVLVWTKDGYLPREYFMITLDQLANQRRNEINRRIAENNKIRTNGLAKIEKDAQKFTIESQYFSFQADLAQADPRSLLKRLSKLKMQRSPELIRIAQVVNNLPEFRRIEYLLGALSKYKVKKTKNRWWLVDENGQDICCYHIPYWFEWGPQATIDAFQAHDQERNANVCRFCGVDLEAIKFDTSEDYIDGYVENIHDVVFHKTTELDKLMSKRYELNSYLKSRFMATIEQKMDIHIDEITLLNLHEQFIIKIMGSLNPDEPMIFAEAWTELGLRGKKWQMSKFIRPDSNDYQYLKRVGKLGSEWIKVINKTIKDLKKQAKIYLLTGDKLLSLYATFFIANLIHVARQAIATILFAQSAELSRSNFKRLRSEVELLLQTNYKHQGYPNPPNLEVKGLGLSLNQNAVDSLYRELPLPSLELIVNTENGALKIDNFTADVTETNDKDYWPKFYQRLVDIYLKVLPFQESPEIISDENVETSGIVFARILPKVSDLNKLSSQTRCHYLQQQKFHVLMKLYVELNHLVNRAKVFSTNEGIHTCYGTQSARLSDFYCPIEDRFYYITRLARGELSDENVKILTQEINQYINSKQLADFHEAFLKLISNMTTETSKKPSKLPAPKLQARDQQAKDQPAKAQQAKDQAPSNVPVVELPQEHNVASKIIELANKYRELKTNVKDCLATNLKIKLIDQIKKGNSRLTSPIEWPLKYEFLKDWVSSKYKKLAFPTKKSVSDMASLFNSLSEKANERNAMLSANESFFNDMFKPSIDWVRHRKSDQTHLVANTDSPTVKSFLDRLGELDTLTKSDPRRPSAGAGDSDVAKWQNRSRPDPFHIWWRSESTGTSRQEALTKWLNLPDTTTDYWKMIARNMPIGYNVCLVEAVQVTENDYAWDTINKLLGYLEILRLYQILFKNILNVKEIPDQVNSSMWPSIQIEEDKKITTNNKYPEWPLEWKTLLRTTKQAQIEGKLGGSLKSTKTSVAIVDFPKSVQRQEKYNLVLETTQKQLNDLVEWLLTSEDTEQPNDILDSNVWDMIDCIDTEKRPENSPKKRPEKRSEKLSKMISIIKWILLNDSLTNYKKNETLTDGKFYLELLQKIWLLIAQLDTSSNTSSVEIDYAIKYYFYELFNNFKTNKEERKKALKEKGKTLAIYDETKDADIDVGDVMENLDENGNPIESEEPDEGEKGDAEGGAEIGEYDAPAADGDDGNIDLAD